MKRGFLSGVALLVSWGVAAAERAVVFTAEQAGRTPPGFRSLLAGTGKPGDWQVVLEETPPPIAPLSPNAPRISVQPVLAQLSRDPTDERFPLLVLDDEIYTDFTLTARLKTVAGAVERMAGLAFRLQDEKNYYAVRISSLGNTFRFYRVANGVRDNPLGPEMPLPSGVWHEVSVECRGNRIRVRLDGQSPIPEITDNSYSEGKIGFWTKSDSVSYFTDVRLDYVPREFLAQVLVRETLAKYSRLLGLKVFSTTTTDNRLRIVASDDPKEAGQNAAQVEKDCVAKDAIFFGKSQERVLVTFPLHDRNGETIGAVRVVMRTFPGQTERNAIARAMPVVKAIETRVRSVKDLTQ